MPGVQNLPGYMRFARLNNYAAGLNLYHDCNKPKESDVPDALQAVLLRKKCVLLRLTHKEWLKLYC